MIKTLYNLQKNNMYIFVVVAQHKKLSSETSMIIPYIKLIQNFKIVKLDINPTNFVISEKYLFVGS